MSPAVPTRDGATVMLVRDGHHPDRPLEVFMLRRHPSTAFGSVHVFPGGVVDASDHAAALDARCPGLTDVEASSVLRVPSGGRAYWIAAIRESFEEAGVLLARHADGPPVRFDGHPDVQARYDDHRRAVHAGARTLLDVLEAEDLVLTAAGVHYVAHWITPEGEPKRFDTRFFLARAPEGQAYAHDDAELIGSEWIRPEDALARHRDGDFPMIGPTTACLQDIGRFATSDALLAAQEPARAGAPRGPGMTDPALAEEVPQPKPIVHGVASALSPLVRRIVANNPGRMTGPGTNTYLVGIDEIVVIDPGPDDAAHLDAIAGCGGDRIRWIVCTHTHVDHFPGVAGLKARTGAEVLAFDARDGLQIDRRLGDGDSIEATEFVLRALHTPGHASNHLCFLLEQERMLFSGDHIMEGSTVVIRPPDGDMATYLRQLERVKALRPRLRSIAPGHGHLIEQPAAKIDEYLQHRAMREQQIASVLSAGRASVAAIVDQLYPDLPDELVPMAAGTVWAHLIKLKADGRAKGTKPDGPWSSA